MVSNSIGDADLRSIEAQTVGALAVVRKPGSVNHQDYEQDRDTMLRTLWLMADVPVVTRYARRVVPPPSLDEQPRARQRPRLLAIAASTGGPAAVQMLLNGLGNEFPLPILLAQHIAHGFIDALVEWLHNTTPLTVKMTYAGEVMRPGHVYLAPDDQHILTQEPGVVMLKPMTASDRYCPSADHLFASVAAVYRAQAMGVILTGMGNDGAQGLRALHDTGALTFAQDESSCVVYGMPQAAVALGAVSHIEPISNLSAAILQPLGRVIAN
jgi:two-component system chemotaxis response regulator CheB